MASNYGSKGKQDANTVQKQAAAYSQAAFKKAETPASVKKYLGTGARVKYRA